MSAEDCVHTCLQACRWILAFESLDLSNLSLCSSVCVCSFGTLTKQEACQGFFGHFPSYLWKQDPVSLMHFSPIHSSQLMFFLRRLFHCTSRNAYCTSTIWCAEQWVFKAAFWPDYSNDDHELPQIGSHTRHSSHNKLQTMLFLQNIVKCDKKWPSFVWPHILLTVSVQPSIHTRTEKNPKKHQNAYHTRVPMF